MVKAFTPRHENFPVFKSATVSDTDGEHSLQVSLVSISRMRDVRAKAKEKNKDKSPVPQSVEESRPVEVNSSNGKKTRTPTMILEAFDAGDGGAEGARAENRRIIPQKQSRTVPNPSGRNAFQTPAAE